jgi:hypothetical protein
MKNIGDIQDGVSDQFRQNEEILRLRGLLPHFREKVLKRVMWTGQQKFALVVSILIAWFATYILLEKALRNCNAPVGELPSWGIVLIGLATLPAIEIALGVIFDAIETVLARR